LAVLALAIVVVAVWIAWLLRPQPRPAAVRELMTTDAEEEREEPVVAEEEPPTRTTPRTETRTETRTPAPAQTRTKIQPKTRPKVPAAAPRPRSRESRVAIPVHLAGEEQARREADGPMKKGDLILDGPGVEEAQLTASPPPTYPPALSGSGRSASVVLEVLVDETGAVVEARVKSATVDDGSADAAFRKAALAAARTARFAPATKHGIAGKMWGELSYEFGPKK